MLLKVSLLSTLFLCCVVSNEAILWRRMRGLLSPLSILKTHSVIGKTEQPEVDNIFKENDRNFNLLEEKLFQMERKVRSQTQIITELRKEKLQIKKELNFSHDLAIKNLTSAINAEWDLIVKKKIEEIDRANKELIQQLEGKHKVEMDRIRLAARTETPMSKSLKFSSGGPGIISKETLSDQKVVKKRNPRKKNEKSE